MQYFWDWAVRPLLTDRRVRSVLEIGASQGGNTDRMLHEQPGVRITVIDPCLDVDLVEKYRDTPAVTVKKATSLEVLPTLEGTFDAILLDGDHNFYTVINELRWIDRRNLLAPGGLILFHDVGAPYAREDLYYQPEMIPVEARAPGQPRGVLTAIEHFRQETRRGWRWMDWSDEHGLGCLFDPRTPSEPRELALKAFAWRGIRWRNRLMRWAGIKPRDTIHWGPLQGR